MVKRSQQFLLIIWVLGTLVGLSIAVILAGFLGEAIARIMGEPALFFVPWGFVVVNGGVPGGTLGLIQWLILRQHMPQAWRWVLASLVGWLAIAFVAFDASESLIFLGLPFVVGGAVLGTAQWLVLRQAFAKAGWWLLATIMGLVIGWHVVWVTGFGLVSLIIGGAVYAVITGLVIVWLLRHPVA